MPFTKYSVILPFIMFIFLLTSFDTRGSYYCESILIISNQISDWGCLLKCFLHISLLGVSHMSFLFCILLGWYYKNVKIRLFAKIKIGGLGYLGDCLWKRGFKPSADYVIIHSRLYCIILLYGISPVETNGSC